MERTNGKAVHLKPGHGDGCGPLRAFGGLVTPKVSGSRTGGAYSLLEVEVGPGGGEGPHVQHREDECFYVLEGAFEFVVEDERIEAGPGSLVYVPRGALHAHRNAGEGPGRMLVIHTPGGPHERFLEEAGEVATDAGRLARVAAEHGIEVVGASSFRPPRILPPYDPRS